MGSIFVSYRRDGGSGFAGRIEADLERRFPGVEVFRDVDDLASGEDFVRGLERALERCSVLLVVIGKAWLTATGASGARRLDEPDDFVRQEIGAALRRDVRVVPVLVEGARMPSEGDLPDEIKPLARRQAHELSDSRWDYDVARLGDSIEEALGGRPRGLGDRRRRNVLLAAAAGSLAAACAVAWYVVSLPPDLDGTWDLPNGSYWIVEQKGRDLTIQEVHYDSKQAWKKGHGSIQGGAVRYRLDFTFQPGYFEEGELRIAQRGRRLTGMAVLRPRDTQDDVILTRR